jgi:hypothetical protein
MGSKRSMPMTWGTIRPKILLPADARQWESSRLESVLLHELAHIRRYDTAIQMLVRLVCAMYWFNPLAWVAARRIELECERACDDLVLAHGMRASDYAENLMQIVARHPHIPSTPGLAMARVSTLETRLTAILDEKLNRRRVTRGMMTVLGLLCAAVVFPMAMLDAVGDEERKADPVVIERKPATVEDWGLNGEDSALATARRQLAELELQHATLLDVFGLKHPKIIASSALIEKSKSKLEKMEARRNAEKLGVPAGLMKKGDPENFAGIGVALNVNEEGFPQVMDFVPDGVAKKSGKIKIGDVIQAAKSGADEWIELQHVRLEAVVALMRGEAGSQLSLRIGREGEAAPLNLEFERQMMNFPPVLKGAPAVEMQEVAEGDEMLRTYSLKFVEAEKAAEMVRNLRLTNGSAIPDSRTNQIVVKGIPATIDTIVDFLKQIDIPTPEVKREIVELVMVKGMLQIYWGGEFLWLNQVKTKLGAYNGDVPEVEVILSANPDVPFEKVSELLKLLTESGVEKLSIETRK